MSSLDAVRQVMAQVLGGALPPPVCGILDRAFDLGIGSVFLGRQAERLKEIAGLDPNQAAARLVPPHLGGAGVVIGQYLHLPYPDWPTIPFRLAQGDLDRSISRHELHQCFASSHRMIRPCLHFDPWTEEATQAHVEILEFLGLPLETIMELVPEAGKRLQYYEQGIHNVFDAGLRGVEGERLLLTIALLIRLTAHYASQREFHRHHIPIRVPLAHGIETRRLLYPFHNCMSYLFEQLFPEGICVARGIPVFEFRRRWILGLNKILMEYFRPVGLAEPLKVNDVIVYFSDEHFHHPSINFHFGRVALVCGPHVWVESKWGALRPPCIHLIGEIPTSKDFSDIYGTNYWVLRLNDENFASTGSHQTFGQAGFVVPGNQPLARGEILQEAILWANQLMVAFDEDRFHEAF